MIRFITSMFIGFLVMCPISAFSMEADSAEHSEIRPKRLITPENSTLLFYEAAHGAYTNLKATTPNNPFLDTSFKTNILQHGNHSGIPENQWTVRGSNKATNQLLLKEISAYYLQSYEWPEGALQVNIFSHNEIERTYIDFSRPYVPHSPAERTSGRDCIC